MTATARGPGSAPASRPLHVLVVDDSALIRRVLTDILSATGRFEVSSAADPLIAMDKMERARPDVILLDLEMPRMDGLTFLRRLRALDSANAVPVVVCSSVAPAGSATALQALREGAVEVVAKPRVGVKSFLEESAVLLADAIRAAALARVPTPPLRERRAAAQLVPAPHRPASRRLVALGASTGGVDALTRILGALPSWAPAMAIVQHMPAGFTRAFAEHLDRICRIEVKEAEDGDTLAPGRAVIAPGDSHIVITRGTAGYIVCVRPGPLVSRHRPSVDVLFRSVAQVAGPDAIGGLLTGMGVDGVDGLLAMRRAGALTLAQDEASSAVFGMPRAALARGAARAAVALSDFAGALLACDGVRSLPHA